MMMESATMCLNSFLRKTNRSSRLEQNLIDVTPDPVLSRLEGLNDRMVGRMEMLGSVLVL
jgi:hypothetical protein